jgi:acyl phosphate:glycerol-3-phosphate acyltransferase
MEYRKKTNSAQVLTCLVLAGFVIGSFIKRWFPWEYMVLMLLGLCVFFFITRRIEISTVIMSGLSTVYILIFPPPGSNFYLSLIVMALIFTAGALDIIRRKSLPPIKESGEDEKKWRFYLRPAAILFLLFYLEFSKKPTLFLIGGVCLIFFGLDIIRLFSKRINTILSSDTKLIYKTKEIRSFSSMSYFLLSCFLSVLIFEKPIAVTALTFLIFGDFFAKFFGLRFVKTRLFKKSLEGSQAHLFICLFSGIIFMRIFQLPVSIIIGGAVCAAFIEALPLRIDDNLTVSLSSGAVMTLLSLISK